LNINNKKYYEENSNKQSSQNEKDDQKFTDNERFFSDDYIKANIILNTNSSSGDIDFNSNSNKNIFMSNNSINQYKLNQYSSITKNIINTNNYNLKLNCQRNDMYYLIETYNNASTLLLGVPNHLNKNNNDINDSQIINANGLVLKDSFKFIFEIKQLKSDNNNNFIKIEIGFKIKYINVQDMNLIIDEHLINKDKINFKIGSLYDSVEIKKNLMIFKNTGKIYVLINVNRGKFFIIGNDELNKRKLNIFLNKTNTEIFFIKNFYSICVPFIKNIEPIFQFDKKEAKNFEIKFNDKIIS
jgi:hypothetical protein